MMRLKAHIYLWSEATDFKTFAAKNEGGVDGAAKAAEAIADVMGAKPSYQPGGRPEGQPSNMTHRINKGSPGVYRVCGKRTHEKRP
jgi:hypothetical protein